MLVLLSVLVVGETVKGPLPNDGETGPAAKGWASVLNTTVKQKRAKSKPSIQVSHLLQQMVRTVINADMIWVIKCEVPIFQEGYDQFPSSRKGSSERKQRTNISSPLQRRSSPYHR